MQRCCMQHNWVAAYVCSAPLHARRQASVIRMHEHARKTTTQVCRIHCKTVLRKATVQTRVPSTPPNLNVGYVLTQSTSSKAGGTDARSSFMSFSCAAAASLLCNPVGAELLHAADSC